MGILLQMVWNLVSDFCGVEIKMRPIIGGGKKKVAYPNHSNMPLLLEKLDWIPYCLRS